MASFITTAPVRIDSNVKFEVQSAMRYLQVRHDLDVKVKWSFGRKRGIFLPEINSIVLGSKMSHPLDSMLHQFCHVYIHNNCMDRERHSLRFLDLLWKVVLDYYKDPVKYSWYDESEEIFCFAHNRIKALEWEN